MTVKAKRSKKKEKKRIDFEKKRTDYRSMIRACLWILIALVVLGLLIWLMLPAAGRRGVPRKSRGLPQTSSEPFGICICADTVQRDALSVLNKGKGDIPLLS